ncbi:MAG: hypothetical protein J1E61_05380 [Lachnospiraceae bacterium]|nr:hypothetical protein [Lachnospiraceae bacterium]
MFEQDYIMRLIKEMIRAILKALFDIDTASPTTELLEQAEEKSVLESLLDMIDEGKINDAENRLSDILATGGREKLKTALLFYSYLNDKDDAFLKEHDFSREEIKLGISRAVSGYGLDGIAELFLS